MANDSQDYTFVQKIINQQQNVATVGIESVYKYTSKSLLRCFNFPRVLWLLL